MGSPDDPTAEHNRDRLTLRAVRDLGRVFLNGADELLINESCDRPVWYRVTGWDEVRKALIVERADPPGERPILSTHDSEGPTC